jgi:hypothetical protein
MIQYVIKLFLRPLIYINHYRECMPESSKCEHVIFRVPTYVRYQIEEPALILSSDSGPVCVPRCDIPDMRCPVLRPRDQILSIG